jgi:hypothetical protein
MKAIDLELLVRSAFYKRFSSRRLQKLCVGGTLAPDDFYELAWGVAPPIFPTITTEGTRQLMELAADMPNLMTREPESVQDIRFDYDILPLTPYRVLHANVVELAMCYAKAELARLQRMGMVLGEPARDVYGIMRKVYVIEGYSWHRYGSILYAQQSWGQTLPWDQERVRQAFLELMQAGVIKRVESQEETYLLQVTERVELIKRYGLRGKWPPFHPAYDVVAQAVLADADGE